MPTIAKEQPQITHSSREGRRSLSTHRGKGGRGRSLIRTSSKEESSVDIKGGAISTAIGAAIAGLGVMLWKSDFGKDQTGFLGTIIGALKWILPLGGGIGAISGVCKLFGIGGGEKENGDDGKVQSVTRASQTELEETPAATPEKRGLLGWLGRAEKTPEQTHKELEVILSDLQGKRFNRIKRGWRSWRETGPEKDLNKLLSGKDVPAVITHNRDNLVTAVAKNEANLITALIGNTNINEHLRIVGIDGLVQKCTPEDTIKFLITLFTEKNKTVRDKAITTAITSQFEEKVEEGNYASKVIKDLSAASTEISRWGMNAKIPLEKFSESVVSALSGLKERGIEISSDEEYSRWSQMHDFLRVLHSSCDDSHSVKAKLKDLIKWVEDDVLKIETTPDPEPAPAPVPTSPDDSSISIPALPAPAPAATKKSLKEVLAEIDTLLKENFSSDTAGKDAQATVQRLDKILGKVKDNPVSLNQFANQIVDSLTLSKDTEDLILPVYPDTDCKGWQALNTFLEKLENTTGLDEGTKERITAIRTAIEENKVYTDEDVAVRSLTAAPKRNMELSTLKSMLDSLCGPGICVNNYPYKDMENAANLKELLDSNKAEIKQFLEETFDKTTIFRKLTLDRRLPMEIRDLGLDYLPSKEDCTKIDPRVLSLKDFRYYVNSAYQNETDPNIKGKLANLIKSLDEVLSPPAAAPATPDTAPADPTAATFAARQSIEQSGHANPAELISQLFQGTTVRGVTGPVTSELSNMQVGTLAPADRQQLENEVAKFGVVRIINCLVNNTELPAELREIGLDVLLKRDYSTVASGSKEGYVKLLRELQQTNKNPKIEALIEKIGG